MNKHKIQKIAMAISIIVLAALMVGVVAANRSLARQSADPDTPQLLAPQTRLNRILGAIFQIGITNQPIEPDFSISAPEVGLPVYPASFDGDVRSLPQVGPSEKKLMRELVLPPDPSAILDPDFVDSVVQEGPVGLDMPVASANFAGLDFNNWGAGWPPDTNGDVGPDHYIQTVNTSIGIYNKTGARLTAFTFDTFFTGTGTPCDADNMGDPVVLYDAVSGRWLITDFAWTDIVNGPFYQCIAVSKTADPVSGGWWMYAIQAHAAYLNDYPKLGVWADGIYMSANLFDILNVFGSASFAGTKVWALNRDDLISGAPLRNVAFTLGTSYSSLLPSHVIGAMPPAGRPAFFGSINGGNNFRLWKFHVDWANQSLSTLTGPTNIAVAGYSSPSNIPQPNGNQLDSLAGRLMMQLQYRNINGTEALWATHSVASGGVSGIRWYEIRNPAGTPSVYQQSTFQPDANYRWMGSLAVDQQGNMAVGYSLSSSSVFPQIRYAGRLVGDPLGQLSQGESTLIAGTGSQTTYNRWGDYSAMTVDPTDGCTFWYTTEYYLANGTNWQTRIGSFKFPSCGGVVDNPPSVSITSPTNGATVAGNVTVTANASDDNGVTQVQFFDGATSIGTDMNGTDGWSVSWNTVGLPEGAHTLTAVATDTKPQSTISSAVSVTVDNVPDATPVLHVGDLDGARAKTGKTWKATVTIRIHDQGHALVSGAVVTGTWSNGGTSTCTTDVNGQCTVTKSKISGAAANVTFTVTNVTKAGTTYNAGANHDPDGDSTGTSIVIAKPL